MSQLNLVAVSNKFLTRRFLFSGARILPNGPEISNAKDDAGSLEGPLEGLDVVEFTLDYFNSLGCPCFGGGGFEVAGDATDCVARGLKKGVGD